MSAAPSCWGARISLFEVGTPSRNRFAGLVPLGSPRPDSLRQAVGVPLFVVGADLPGADRKSGSEPEGFLFLLMEKVPWCWVLGGLNRFEACHGKIRRLKAASSGCAKEPAGQAGMRGRKNCPLWIPAHKTRQMSQ